MNRDTIPFSFFFFFILICYKSFVSKCVHVDSFCLSFFLLNNYPPAMYLELTLASRVFQGGDDCEGKSGNQLPWC
jgi:hypothetical protein